LVAEADVEEEPSEEVKETSEEDSLPEGMAELNNKYIFKVFL